MSKKGTSTFIFQRASAVVLIPLALFLLFKLVVMIGADVETARAILRNPWNASFFGAFVIVGAFHMRIGLEEIIVDYVYSWVKDVMLFINWLVALGVIGAAGWAVYTLSFAG
jgi:succinate dehydrogenase / fumarate reductase membrane anchor subunit